MCFAYCNVDPSDEKLRRVEEKFFNMDNVYTINFIIWSIVQYQANIIITKLRWKVPHGGES